MQFTKRADVVAADICKMLGQVKNEESLHPLQLVHLKDEISIYSQVLNAIFHFRSFDFSKTLGLFRSSSGDTISFKIQLDPNSIR